MKRKSIQILLIALLACFTAAVAAQGGDPHPRPIMGFMSGDAAWAPEEYCNGVNFDPLLESPITSYSSMFGDVSHLGSAEYHSMHCSTDDGLHLTRGKATLIAANGDEIWLEYTANAIPPVMIPGIVVYEVMNEVVGGTGRFEDASGVIPALVFVTLTFDGGIPNAELEMEFAGNLSY